MEWKAYILFPNEAQCPTSSPAQVAAWSSHTHELAWSHSQLVFCSKYWVYPRFESLTRQCLELPRSWTLRLILGVVPLMGWDNQIFNVEMFKEVLMGKKKKGCFNERKWGVSSKAPECHPNIFIPSEGQNKNLGCRRSRCEQESGLQWQKSHFWGGTLLASPTSLPSWAVASPWTTRK